MSPENLQLHHLIVYSTTKHHNRIYIDDANTIENILEINLGKGYEGNITGVEVYGRYMFVILKYVKTVQVYDLDLVIEGLDEPICLINHLTLYKMGIKYFSP